MINIKQKIDIIRAYKNNMSEAELARLMSETPQNVNRKLKGDIKVSFLESLATALDCQLEITFIDNKTNQRY